jgi:hypothetical protein
MFQRFCYLFLIVAFFVGILFRVSAYADSIHEIIQSENFERGVLAGDSSPIEIQCDDQDAQDEGDDDSDPVMDSIQNKVTKLSLILKNDSKVPRPIYLDLLNPPPEVV